MASGARNDACFGFQKAEHCKTANQWQCSFRIAISFVVLFLFVFLIFFFLVFFLRNFSNEEFGGYPISGNSVCWM